jgi:hypothetical protein
MTPPTRETTTVAVSLVKPPVACLPAMATIVWCAFPVAGGAPKR